MKKLNDFLAQFKDKSQQLNDKKINIKSEFAESLTVLE